MDLIQLQNLTKRDPLSYKDEFLLQLRHYENQLEIFYSNPTAEGKEFSESVHFLSQISACYPKDLEQFPQQLCDLLEQHGDILQPAIRKSLVKALILVRNRDLLPPISLLTLFFKLFKIKDKKLREVLYKHIISDIKTANLKHKNVKLNKTLQNLMYSQITDNNDVSAKKSLDILVELYNKKIWDDAKTINIIEIGLANTNPKIVVKSLKFFLTEQNVGFPAVDFIHDPQKTGELVLKRLRKSNERFDVKVLMIQFLSRLINVHKLIIENYYPFIQSYMQPHQENITLLLASIATACHDLISPDIISTLINTLVNNFVSDKSSDGAIIVGLNTIREICSRCPGVIDAELLSDLVQYKKFRGDKGVVMAARGIITLFREIDPNLLHKRERGKEVSSKNTKKRKFEELMAENSDDEDDEDKDDDNCSSNEVEDDSSLLPGEVDPRSIYGQQKRRKLNKEERVDSAKSGRIDGQKYGSKKGKERSSTTNAEKRKNKPFLLTNKTATVQAKLKDAAHQRKMAKQSRDKNKKKRKHTLGHGSK